MYIYMTVYENKIKHPINSVRYGVRRYYCLIVGSSFPPHPTSHYPGS